MINIGDLVIRHKQIWIVLSDLHKLNFNVFEIYPDMMKIRATGWTDYHIKKQLKIYNYQ